VLKNERARKKFYKRTFLKENPEGTLVVNGIHYIETSEETQTIGVFFRFEENEANGNTIREYGFFGGNVQYVDGVDSDYAANGVYHPDTDPTGVRFRHQTITLVKAITCNRRGQVPEPAPPASKFCFVTLAINC